jgi:hypothetical protein
MVRFELSSLGSRFMDPSAATAVRFLKQYPLGRIGGVACNMLQGNVVLISMITITILVIIVVVIIIILVNLVRFQVYGPERSHSSQVPQAVPPGPHGHVCLHMTSDNDGSKGEIIVIIITTRAK